MHDTDGIDELIASLRAVQGDVLQHHTATVDALAAVQSSDLTQLPSTEIERLAQLAVTTVRADIAMLMGMGHLIDILADYFTAVRAADAD